MFLSNVGLVPEDSSELRRARMAAKINSEYKGAPRGRTRLRSRARLTTPPLLQS